MKIAYIAAGAGGMYCGSCIHDNTTAAALQKLGHDVALLPTYTPMRTDEESVSSKRVFYGAVGVYLEQKSAFFRKRHRVIDWLLNRPALLNLAAKFSGSTDARELGGLALSVLRGEKGSAQKELDELVAWLRDQFQPDVVHITNSMFLGLVRRFKQELGVPVVVAVQGEDLFLDELPAEFRERVLGEMRARAEEADAFLAPNRFYAAKMSGLLGVPESKMRVVPLGLKLEGHEAPLAGAAASETPSIGYLARICPEKGFHLLVEAFCRLAKEAGRETLRLRVAGYLGPKDRPYYREVERKIVEAGLVDRYDFLGEVDRDAKIAFLRSIDLLSVPTVYVEAKGLFVLEALANAVPVVQPRHGSFPELLESTGGGVLVEPGSAESLTEGLRSLLDDPDRRSRLGASGRKAVLEGMSDRQMAEATLELYQQLSRPPAPSAAPAS